jgi:hypothetical protein
MPCRMTRAPINLATRPGESDARRPVEAPVSSSAALQRLHQELELIKRAISALESLQRRRQVRISADLRRSVSAKKKPKRPAEASER